MLTLQEIGALLVAIVVLFILGRAWIRLVDAVKNLLFKPFARKKEPPVWHTLEEAQKETRE